MLVDPWTAPESYAADLYRMTDNAQAAGLDVLAPALESSYAEGFQSTDAMAAAVAAVMLDSQIERIWQRAGQRSNREAVRHWLAEARRAGILDDVNEPDLPDRIREAWERENIERYRKLRDRVKRQTEQYMRTERQRNVGAATAASGLIALGLPTFNGRMRGRGRVVAADQLETLGGLIARHQQTDAGIEFFVWVSRDDDRVRPRHVELNGQRFRWEEPPPEGHPGIPIRCRCISRGVVPA